MYVQFQSTENAALLCTYASDRTHTHTSHTNKHSRIKHFIWSDLKFLLFDHNEQIRRYHHCINTSGRRYKKKPFSKEFSSSSLLRSLLRSFAVCVQSDKLRCVFFSQFLFVFPSVQKRTHTPFRFIDKFGSHVFCACEHVKCSFHDGLHPTMAATNMQNAWYLPSFSTSFLYIYFILTSVRRIISYGWHP